jgi:hypothetical protein
MFGVFANSLFRASGFNTPRKTRDNQRSWYRDDLGAVSSHKRWEDWK